MDFCVVELRCHYGPSRRGSLVTLKLIKLVFTSDLDTNLNNYNFIVGVFFVFYIQYLSQYNFDVKTF